MINTFKIPKELTILKISVYSLKSQFQSLLRPIQHKLMRIGVTPNQITLFACGLCLLYSALLAWSPYTQILLALLPVLMLLRMALNALDGMVAVASNNQTAEGAVLNELCDIISDAALFSAFFVLLASIKEWWWLLTLLALLTEFVSLAVYQAKGIRPHSGPFGKSDRAVYLGLLGVILAVIPAAISTTTNWLTAYCALGLILAMLTIWNRFTFVRTSE